MVSKKQNEEQQKLTIDVQTGNKSEIEGESENESENAKNDEVIFVRKVPTHPRNHLKWEIHNFLKMARKNIDILLTNYSNYGIHEKDETFHHLIKRHQDKPKTLFSEEFVNWPITAMLYWVINGSTWKLIENKMKNC